MLLVDDVLSVVCFSVVICYCCNGGCCVEYESLFGKYYYLFFYFELSLVEILFVVFYELVRYEWQCVFVWNYVNC